MDHNDYRAHKIKYITDQLEELARDSSQDVSGLKAMELYTRLQTMCNITNAIGINDFTKSVLNRAYKTLQDPKIKKIGKAKPRRQSVRAISSAFERNRKRH